MKEERKKMDNYKSKIEQYFEINTSKRLRVRFKN